MVQEVSLGCEEDKAFIELRIGGFQMGDLPGKIGGVTGAEHKQNKLVPPETITWLQGGHNKIVSGGHITFQNKGSVARWLLTTF